MKTNNIFDIIFVGDIEGENNNIVFFGDDALCLYWRDKNIQNWRCTISILKGVPTEIPRFRNQNLRGLCDGHCFARPIPTKKSQRRKKTAEMTTIGVYVVCGHFWWLCLFPCLFIDSPTRSGLLSMPLSCLVLSSLCLCCVFFVFDYFFVILLICFSFY